MQNIMDESWTNSFVQIKLCYKELVGNSYSQNRIPNNNIHGSVYIFVVVDLYHNYSTHSPCC